MDALRFPGRVRGSTESPSASWTLPGSTQLLRCWAYGGYLNSTWGPCGTQWGLVSTTWVVTW